MPKDNYKQNTIDFFNQFPAAHLVLCTNEKKAFIQEWQKYPAALSDIQTHNKLVGLIPASLDLAVLDVDTGDATKLIEKYPPLCVVSSQRKGGLHLYYGCEESLGNLDWTAHGCGGEVRGGNGCVVLWDVVRLRSALLEHDPRDYPFPTEILKSNKSNVPPDEDGIPGSSDDVQKAVSELENTTEGSRNNVYNKLVNRLSKRGYDRTDLAPIKEVYRNLVRGTKDEKQVEPTFESAYMDGRTKFKVQQRKTDFRTYTAFINGIKSVGYDLRYDVLSDAIQFRVADGQFKHLTDTDEARLKTSILNDTRIDFRDRWSMFKKTYAWDRKCNAFVDDYLDTLPEWDSEPRLGKLFIDAFGIKNCNEQLLQAAGRFTLCSIVARAYNKIVEKPTRFEYFIVLMGVDEGEGKSSFFRHLLPDDKRSDWFSESFDIGASDVEARAQLEGNVIVECGELVGLRRAELERFKRIITSPFLPKIRKKYDRNASVGVRTDVLFGTTNDDRPIPHTQSKARRWLPIDVSGADPDNVIKYLDANRSQLWAEAIATHKNTPLYFNKKLEQKQTQRNREFMNVSADLEDAVRTAANDMQSFTTIQLIDQLHERYQKTQGRSLEMTVAKILLNIGYKRDKTLTTEFGIRGRFWRYNNTSEQLCK